MDWKAIEIFKNIIRLAVHLKHGLLWGKDLRLFYKIVSFDEDEITPVDLNNLIDSQYYKA